MDMPNRFLKRCFNAIGDLHPHCKAIDSIGRHIANQNIAIEMLNDFGILQKPDNDLESKVTHHTDSIKLNKYRNKKFVKQENDLNDNLVENIEEDYLEYYDEFVELENSEETMKLVRKKKE